MSRLVHPLALITALLLSWTLPEKIARGEDWEPLRIRFWGIEIRGDSLCEDAPNIDRAIAEQLEQLGQTVERRPQEIQKPGCMPRQCAAAWPSSKEMQTLVLGGFIEKLPGDVSRARLWVYSSNKQQVSYEDVMLLPDVSPSNKLAYHAADLIENLEEAPPESTIPTYCEVPESRAVGTCRPFEQPRCHLRLQLARHPSAAPQRWEWLPIAGSIFGLAASIGFGVANETSTLDGKYAYVLTPAFWASTALTVVLAASSTAIVSDRYRREKLLLKELAVPR